MKRHLDSVSEGVLRVLNSTEHRAVGACSYGASCSKPPRTLGEEEENEHWGTGCSEAELATEILSVESAVSSWYANDGAADILLDLESLQRVLSGRRAVDAASLERCLAPPGRDGALTLPRWSTLLQLHERRWLSIGRFLGRVGSAGCREYAAKLFSLARARSELEVDSVAKILVCELSGRRGEARGGSDGGACSVIVHLCSLLHTVTGPLLLVAVQLLQQLVDVARNVDASTPAGSALDRVAVVAETVLHELLTCAERDASASALAEACAAGGSASNGPAPSDPCCAAHSLERLLRTLASSLPSSPLLGVLRSSTLAFSSAGNVALEAGVCRCLCRMGRAAEVIALADELASSALALQARPPIFARVRATARAAGVGGAKTGPPTAARRTVECE